MDNWRKPRTSTDTPGNSSNSRPNTSKTRSQYFQQYRTPKNVQKPENSTSSLSFQSASKRHFDLQRRKREAFSVVQDLKDLNQKNSSEIIIELTTNLNDFGQMLMSDNLEPNWIVLVISILSKVCLSCFRESKLSILKVAINETFLQTLEKYVRQLKRKEGRNPNGNNHFLNNQEEFIVNLVFVCEFFVEIIPNNYSDMLHNLLKAMELFPCAREGANIERRQKTNSNIKILREKLNLRQELHPEQEIGMLSVYPSIEEILTSSSGVRSEYFAKGKNENVKNYLDVHKQFLKENFAAALQKGIAHCFEHTQGANSHLKSFFIRMYEDVRFGSMSFDYNELGVKVNFSSKEDLKEISSPRSRCFKWGSVVCFTKDNFSTFFFGSVIKKNCGRKHLIVRFEPKYKNYESNVAYTMVECNIELYPYFHIFQALTTMSEVNFPLKNYFIDAVQKVELPSYLDSTSSIYLGQFGRVDVFGNNWPSADQLKLDFTQYSAFRAALTQKFVTILGAPGTGKTYLGLEIVKTLLHQENQKLWYDGTPILVICMSNQVLDQFLEGVLSTTKRIIRVGVHLESDKLANFTLTSARTRRYLGPSVLLPVKKKQEKVIEQLKAYQDSLSQINNFNNILIFSNFECIDKKFKASWFSRASKADILAWLFDEERQNLHFPEISEIINDIKEKQKQCDSGEANSALGKQGNTSNKILWSQSRIWNQIVRIGSQVENMEASTPAQSKKLSKLQARLKYLWKDFQYFKMKMSDRPSPQSVSKPVHMDYHSPQNMDPKDRWDLYFYWLNLYKKFVDEKFLELQNEHQQISQNITEMLNISDSEIMKRSLVLGMTFTSAARLHLTLQSLKCRIVMVEEACQVSESNLMVSLTKHCENLILLGNHQDLQSTSATPGGNLGTPNLMDRLLGNNSMPCHILSVQHRVLPEMDNYHKFQNHPSVSKCPPILGMQYCYYFLHHEHPDVNKSNSKANLYEAKFLVNFARYLRQVGYPAEEISILSIYSGQTEILVQESVRHADLLQGVRISTIDRYTDNCKIILLSLVRSNAERVIGRLEYENFVTFALSRANEALYMMGNLDLLCEKSKIWGKVKEILVEQNCVGDYLPVSCKANPEHITKIKEPKDFDEVTKKVCRKICGILLHCGHFCSKSCHPLDDHSPTACSEFCL